MDFQNSYSINNIDDAIFCPIKGKLTKLLKETKNGTPPQKRNGLSSSSRKTAVLWDHEYRFKNDYIGIVLWYTITQLKMGEQLLLVFFLSLPT